MKITEFSQITDLASDSVLLVDGSTGTKKILTKDAIEQMLSQMSPQTHRMMFRGKNLGGSLTDAQKTAIANGTFEDIFLGDYWTIGGVTYRVADFDYFYRVGDTDFTKHNLVLVPDASMYSHVMNDTNTTEGGYTGSKMYTEGLNQAKETITAAFGSAVLTHKDYLTNAVSNGRPSGGAWFESTVELLNENMLYGTNIFTPHSDGSSVPALYTTGKGQLALFQAVPHYTHNRQWFWLRDVVSSTLFARCYIYGGADSGGASGSPGVRPYFIIG